jgi:hypothetical protein
MSDFATVAAEIVAGVLNNHPNTTALVKAAMVRQLLSLQAEKAPFMEKSGSFNTVANQAAYTYASTGMPPGLLSFERLWYDQGATGRPIEVVDMGTIRMLQENGSTSYPFRVAWWEERLQFGPAPAGIYPVKWDIILDATKDTATGTVLTVADTTKTNAWFLAPQSAVFKHLVWADYFSTSPDQRPELAASHQQLATVALARLREANAKRQQMGGLLVQPSSWDGYDRSVSSRISTLFPGAPV